MIGSIVSICSIVSASISSCTGIGGLVSTASCWSSRLQFENRSRAGRAHEVLFETELRQITKRAEARHGELGCEHDRLESRRHSPSDIVCACRCVIRRRAWSVRNTVPIDLTRGQLRSLTEFLPDHVRRERIRIDLDREALRASNARVELRRQRKQRLLHHVDRTREIDAERAGIELPQKQRVRGTWERVRESRLPVATAMSLRRAISQTSDRFGATRCTAATRRRSRP